MNAIVRFYKIDSQLPYVLIVVIFLLYYIHRMLITAYIRIYTGDIINKNIRIILLTAASVDFVFLNAIRHRRFHYRGHIMRGAQHAARGLDIRINRLAIGFPGTHKLERDHRVGAHVTCVYGGRGTHKTRRRDGSTHSGLGVILKNKF